MHRALSSKRENFFKDSSSPGTDSSYDGLKLSRDTGSLLGSDKILSNKMGDLDSIISSNGSTASIKSTGLGNLNNTSKYSNFSGNSDAAVGFANLPNQTYRKAMRRGFEFNLMVVGESGLGKSTFLNSLFLTDLYNAENLGPSKRLKKTVYVEPHTTILKENGVVLKLTLIDTPGFGDAVDNSNCWQPVLEYVDSKFEDYLTSESRVQRGGTVPDNRVHACLYFLPPTGHGLRPLDIEFMLRIMEKVNLIPVIAKADSMTIEEVRDFKKTINNELLQNKIRVYEFPDSDGGLSSTEDETELTKFKRLKERIPFAVVGANAVMDKGSRMRGRSYPWGVVEVDNLEHNDFLALRNLLIRSHMQDLKDTTSTAHYENYRHAKLSGIAQEGKFQTKDGKDPMTHMEHEKREHEQKMKKMEAEMGQVFEQKVKEKRQKLKESEVDLQRRAEQMTLQLEQQEVQLQERRKQFEAERATWEENNRDWDRLSQENVSGGVLGDKGKEKKKKGIF